jgi:hypothetical protein
MKAKISKAQLEVWEWKERAFKNLEEIPEEERVKYIFSKTNKTISRLKKLKELTNR